MPNNPDPTELVHLADQWTVLRERYAFQAEALLRLVADHPDLAPDVIQGATQNVQDTGRMASTLSESLNALIGSALPIDRREDSS